MSLLSLISFLATFQLLFVGIFLVTHRKGKRKNNMLLGVIFLMIAWNMGDLTLRVSDLQMQWAPIRKIGDGFFLLYGPLFYIYTQAVIYKKYKPARWIVLHFIPYVFFTLVLLTSDNSQAQISQSQESVHWYFHIFSSFLYLHIIVYVIVSYQSILRYRSILKDQFSKVDDMNLNWLSFMLTSFGVLTIVSLIHNYFVLDGSISVYMSTLVVFLLFIFYLVNRVIFKALKQPEIFAGITQEGAVKYSGSYLTQDQIKNYKDELVILVRAERLYLNPQISITELAKMLDLSPKHLSQVINQSFNRNFFDFINSFRIEEAKDIMEHSEDDKLTVLEVMYQVGFNSKSSFNTAFKKETGHTPSAFKKSLQK